ncbi:MAG: hypothetical protein Ta2E_05380 [Mycoplasmoidaceae bacterium]|nr:MAG: hypothetical protein Ta2E_05380 [Mycoplasmoidaceae bacterium]
MFRLLKYLHKKELLLYLVLVIFLLCQVTFTLMIPVQISRVLHLTEISNPTAKQIALQCSLLGIYVVIISLLTVATSYISNHIACKFSVYLRSEIFIKVNKLSLSQINKISIPSIIGRATQDIDYLQFILIQIMVVTITAPGTALGGLVVMAIFPNPGSTGVLDTSSSSPWQLVVMTIGVIVIMVAGTVTVAIVIIPKIKSQQRNSDMLYRQTREALKGIRVITAFDSLDYHKTRFDETSEKTKRDNTIVNGINATNSPTVSLITSSLTIGIYWMGAYLLGGKHNISYSSLMGYATLSGAIVSGFLAIAVFCVMIPQLQITVKRINEILDCKIEINEDNWAKFIENVEKINNENNLFNKKIIEFTKSGDKDKVAELKELILLNNAKVENLQKNFKIKETGSLEFRNVSFKYAGAKEDILSDISFKANPREFVGIIGQTGSGKSTLINMIPRFYDPVAGKILIDGVDTKNYKLSILRSKIGYSPQQASLLNRSINENIGLQYDDIQTHTTTKKIELASDVSQAKSFIEKLDNKYATVITQNATNISGGQKQRLSIARSIVDSPEIMLFDDSFSALDYSTDLKLRTSLFTTYKDSTKIVVASRVATIMKADKIIVLDHGTVVGIGKHNVLFKKCPLYHEIVLSQMTEKEALNG